MPGRSDVVRERLHAIAERPRGQGRLHRWLSKIDPQSGRKIAPADRHRVERALEVWITSGRPISEWDRPDDAAEELPAIKIALTLGRARLVEILDARVDAMYAAGLVDETRELLAQFPRAARPFGTIGYKEAAAVVANELPLADAVAETRRRTRSYAKRQMTWLRSERNVQWIDAGDRDAAFATAMRLISEGER
jgi:tRNA dimethylallyltransferase